MLAAFPASTSPAAGMLPGRNVLPELPSYQKPQRPNPESRSESDLLVAKEADPAFSLLLFADRQLVNGLWIMR